MVGEFVAKHFVEHLLDDAEHEYVLNLRLHHQRAATQFDEFKTTSM